ncbi:hypothetical protein D3C76_1690310 [compost metagenome]
MRACFMAGSLLRYHVADETAKAVDLDFHAVAGLHVDTAFRGPGDQYVAFVQGHEFADLGD